MNNIKDESLQRAFKQAKIYALPKALSPGSNKIWTRAIVEVFKYDCSTSYCLAVNDGSGNPRITFDFGNMSRIMEYRTIHPYDFLKKSDIPDMKKPSDVAIYLIGHGYEKKDIVKLMSNKKEDGTPKTEEEFNSDLDLIRKYINYVAITEYNRNKDMEAEDE